MLHLKKVILFLLCSWLFSYSGAFAYSLDSVGNAQATKFVQLIHKKFNTLSTSRAQAFELSVQNKLVQLQNALIKKSDKNSLQENALYEAMRRKLLPDSFDTPEMLFDDGVGAFWTHAPHGFGILYNPIETPSIGSLASGTKNTLINGSYFSRVDGAKNHVGLLWNAGLMWSSMVYDDSQVTHVVCMDSNKQLTFWQNNLYFDEITNICTLAFQAGPLVYSLRDGEIVENTSSRSYIGRSHNRTLIVLFSKNGVQDLWFLTLIKPATLSEVRDTVLRESRFRGEYDALTIFNLDGGSSVAYRNPDHPELNFGSSKTLPVVFEIYK